MTTKSEIRKGLYGVVADYTAVSKVMPETNSLTYAGYPVQELAKHCSFEEVAYLLWNGELPDSGQLEEFAASERELRGLTEAEINLIESMPKDAHPMDTLRTFTSFVGQFDDHFTRDADHIREIGLRLLAKFPTAVALDIRRRKGKGYVEPSKEKGFAENFLWMVFGDEDNSPALQKEAIQAFDRSLILYAEHSFNASTFSSRVITSTTSDVYSAVTGGIGALKGPLHGGGECLMVCV